MDQSEQPLKNGSRSKAQILREPNSLWHRLVRTELDYIE